MQDNAITIELSFGHKDESGELHSLVTIGRRPAGKDLHALGRSPMWQSNSFILCGLLRASITRFGSLPVPIPTKVLLGLDSADLDDITKAQERYLELSAHGRKVERLSADEARLALGFEIGGRNYGVVRFQEAKLTEVELEHISKAPWIDVAFLTLEREILRISTPDNLYHISGPIGLDRLARLDYQDLEGLMRINTERVNGRLGALSRIGRLAGGRE